MPNMVIILIVLALFQPFSGVHGCTLTVSNHCNHTIWPGTVSNFGTLSPSATGFVLRAGKSKNISLLASWSGRVWGRTGCTKDAAGIFYCLSGDCGSGTVECGVNHTSISPPATVAAFTLNGGEDGLDRYGVNFLQRYNLPMIVEPQRHQVGEKCPTAGCGVDLIAECPPKSFSCMLADYVVTFCPTTISGSNWPQNNGDAEVAETKKPQIPVKDIILLVFCLVVIVFLLILVVVVLWKLEVIHLNVNSCRFCPITCCSCLSM